MKIIVLRKEQLAAAKPAGKPSWRPTGTPDATRRSPPASGLTRTAGAHGGEKGSRHARTRLLRALIQQGRAHVKAPALAATLPRSRPTTCSGRTTTLSPRLRRPRGGRRPAPRPPAGGARRRPAPVHPRPAGPQLRRSRPARHRVRPALLDQAHGRRAARMAVRAPGAPIPARSLDTLPPAQVLLPHLGPLPHAVSPRAAPAPHRTAGLLPGTGPLATPHRVRRAVRRLRARLGPGCHASLTCSSTSRARTLAPQLLTVQRSAFVTPSSHDILPPRAASLPITSRDLS